MDSLQTSTRKLRRQMLRAKSADSKSADDAGGGESEAPPKYDIMSNEESAFDSVAKKSNGIQTTALMSRRLISLGLSAVDGDDDEADDDDDDVGSSTASRIDGRRVSSFFEEGGGMKGLETRWLLANINNKSDQDTICHIVNRLRKNYLFLSLSDKELFDLTLQFEVAKYNVGDVIVEQGDKADNGYYYMLVEGECSVFKNGKKLSGKYGTMLDGSAFGEQAALFDSSARGASIVASKGSEKEENTGCVVLYRLAGKKFRRQLGKEELTALQNKITSVMKVFDSLSGIDTKIHKKGTIIRPYEPDTLSLLHYFRGTVLQYVWPNVLFWMAITAAFGVLTDHFSGGIGSGLEEDPEPNTLLWHLNFLSAAVARMGPLTTFVTTFFLNQAFTFWSRFYWTTRGIQGRLSDISLILASHAACDENGEITEEAKHALDDIARIQRILHQLFWSTVVKRFNSLHSPEGLSYLLAFRLIKEDEYSALVAASANKLGVHHASMLFMTKRIVIAKESGEIKLDTASTQMVFDKITNLRMLMARIPDMYDGRMPLQYVHFVNMLVTTFIFLTPFALFPVFYYWSILAVGLTTLFYRGILTLSLMFLDPVDNDTYHSKFVESAGFDIGVLIREANAGSVRFSDCAECLPKGYLASLKNNQPNKQKERESPSKASSSTNSTANESFHEEAAALIDNILSAKQCYTATAENLGKPEIPIERDQLSKEVINELPIIFERCMTTVFAGKNVKEELMQFENQLLKEKAFHATCENDFSEAEMARLLYLHTANPIPAIAKFHETTVAQKKKALDESAAKRREWQDKIDELKAEMELARIHDNSSDIAHRGDSTTDSASEMDGIITSGNKPSGNDEEKDLITPLLRDQFPSFVSI